MLRWLWLAWIAGCGDAPGAGAADAGTDGGAADSPCSAREVWRQATSVPGEAWDVAVLGAGAAAAGTTREPIGSDIFVHTYEEGGVAAWGDEYSNEGGLDANDTGQGVASTASGSVIAVGSLAGATSGWVRGYDETGRDDWTDFFSGQAKGVALDASGTAYVAGVLEDDRGGDALLRRYDTEGGLAWEQSWAGAYADSADAVALTPQGDLVVAGGTQEEYGEWRVWIAKYDAAGAEIWSRPQPTPGAGLDVAVDPPGNLLVAGWTGAGGATEAWIAQYGPDGDEIWSRTIDADRATSVTTDSSGVVYVALQLPADDEPTRPSLAAFTPEGEEIWTCTLPGGSLRAVAVDPDGDVLVAGADGEDVLVAALRR